MLSVGDGLGHFGWNAWTPSPKAETVPTATHA